MNELAYRYRPYEMESLAVAMRAALRSQVASGRAGTGKATSASGCDELWEYAELVRLLGLDLLTVAVEGECPRRWRCYARDAGLTEFAAWCGLRVRELHPPQATTGLDGTPEFADHFRDSYLPLMREALRNGQSVLAWRGWPPPAEYEWGIVVRIDDDGAVYGYAPDSSCSSVPARGAGHSEPLIQMSGPALQVYVVEGWQPPEPPTFEHQLRHRLRLAVAAFDGALPSAPDVLLGRAAYGLWCKSLRDGSLCPRCRADGASCQQEAVKALLVSRSVLWADLTAAALRLTGKGGRCTAGNKPGGPGVGGTIELLKGWAESVREVRARPEQYAGEVLPFERLSSRGGRQELSEALDVARRAEEQFIERVARPWLAQR
jgi:hypothetical protein